MLSPSGNLLIANLGTLTAEYRGISVEELFKREPERYCRLVGGILVWIGSYLADRLLYSTRAAA